MVAGLAHDASAAGGQAGGNKTRDIERFRVTKDAEIIGGFRLPLWPRFDFGCGLFLVVRRRRRTRTCRHRRYRVDDEGRWGIRRPGLLRLVRIGHGAESNYLTSTAQSSARSMQKMRWHASSFDEFVASHDIACMCSWHLRQPQATFGSRDSGALCFSESICDWPWEIVS